MLVKQEQSILNFTIGAMNHQNIEVVYYCFTTIELVISCGWLSYIRFGNIVQQTFSGRRQPCIVQEQNAAVCLPRCSA